MIPRIDQVLNLTRPLVGLDEETTGVDPKRSGICELGLEIYVPGKPVKEFRTLINPMMPIPKEATAIHGITNDMVRGAPTFVQLAANLFHGMQGCDFIGYNVRFDLDQLVEEFKRANMPWHYEEARILDGYRIWQLVEGRTLTHAVDRWLGGSERAELEAFPDDGDRSSQQAHNALWDIKMSTRVVAAQLQRCDQLPKDLDQLHELQWPGYYDAQGKLRWEGRELCVGFGQHRKKPLRLVPKGYLSFILKADFSDKVKDAVRGALKGNYPVRTQPVELDADDPTEPADLPADPV